MHRLLITAFLAATFLPGSARAIEITNVRSSYGLGGATRKDNALINTDTICITYDIEKLALDPKTGKANFKTTLEFSNDNGDLLFDRKVPSDIVPQLGGDSMPGEIFLTVSPKQAQGNYIIRLTVEDTIGKDTKSFKYDFKVVGESFGIVNLNAAPIGFTTQPYALSFALVNAELEKNQPNVEMTLRMLDSAGKQVGSPVTLTLPKDLPKGIDLAKQNYIPLVLPARLNRLGSFTVEVVAHDKNTNKKVELRYPLTVLDLGKYIEK